MERGWAGGGGREGAGGHALTGTSGARGSAQDGAPHGDKHTIVLLQSGPHPSSRTYMDFQSIAEALDGLCGLFEKKLKELNPTRAKITYDIQDLYTFIDTHAEVAVLALESASGTYVPYNNEWVKKKVYQHLKRQAR